MDDFSDAPSLRESPKLDLNALSDDAKVIAGSAFGLLIQPGKGSVTFQTPWNRTPRAIAAYDELVAAGVITQADGEEGRWARTYRALVDCTPARRWFGENLDKGAFGVMVPDAERRERPPRGWTPLVPRNDGASPQSNPPPSTTRMIG